MTAARQRLGRQAEEMAAERLLSLGYDLLERNARVPGVRGEIDLVLRERATGALVFVEVKARSAAAIRGPQTPLEMVGRRKQAMLRSLAAAWLAAGRAGGGGGGLRFDVVGVTLDKRGRVAEWCHVKAAF